MSLSTEQSIEIAEKIWGWSRKDQYDFYGKQALKVGLAVSHDYSDIAFEIQKEVNSWSGFGRTVEAMEEKGFYLGLNCYQNFGFYKKSKPMAQIDLGGGTFEWMERTHLASLEALGIA